MNITLREITEDTLTGILKLNVTEIQKKCVAPNAVSIAQAHFSEEAWFRGIYNDDTPVGFIMMHNEEKKAEYYLWRFMIDKQYQKSGFGRKAIELMIEYVKSRPNAVELLTSCVPGKDGPELFYQKLGFKSTGEFDEGEEVYKLKL